jgi:hypothetical protein
MRSATVLDTYQSTASSSERDASKMVLKAVACMNNLILYNQALKKPFEKNGFLKSIFFISRSN